MQRGGEPDGRVRIDQVARLEVVGYVVEYARVSGCKEVKRPDQNANHEQQDDNVLQARRIVVLASLIHGCSPLFPSPLRSFLWHDQASPV